MKNESVIDFPREGLCPEIWEKAIAKDAVTETYFLKPEVKERVLAIHTSLQKAAKVKFDVIHITGSITSNSYTENGDIDVHFLNSKKKYSEADAEKINKAIRKAYVQEFIGKHPFEVYFQNNEFQDYMSVGCYDVLKEEWIVGPALTDQSFNPYSEYYRDVQKNAKAIVVEIRNMILDIYEQAVVCKKNLGTDFEKECVGELVKKLSKADELYQRMREMRKAYSAPTSFEQALEYRNSRKWKIADATFKLFDKFGYLAILKDFISFYELIKDSDDVTEEVVNGVLNSVKKYIANPVKLSEEELFEDEIIESENGKMIAYHVSNIPPEKIREEGFKAGQGNGATDTNLFDDLYEVDYPKNYLFVSKEPWDVARPDKYKYCYKIDITGMDLYPDFGMLSEFGAYNEDGDEEQGQVFWWKDNDLKLMKNRALRDLIAKQGGQLTTNEMMGGETVDSEYFPVALYDALGSAVVDGDAINRDKRIIGVEDRTANEGEQVDEDDNADANLKTMLRLYKKHNIANKHTMAKGKENGESWNLPTYRPVDENRSYFVMFCKEHPKLLTLDYYVSEFARDLKRHNWTSHLNRIDPGEGYDPETGKVDFKKGVYKMKFSRAWNLIDPVQYKSILEKFIADGEMTNTSMNTLRDMLDAICENVLAIAATHTIQSILTNYKDTATTDDDVSSARLPWTNYSRKELEDMFVKYGIATRDNVKKLFGSGFEFWYKRYARFNDYHNFDQDSEADTDFGLPQYVSELGNLPYDPTPTEAIVCINRCIDFGHGRGDLASAFIKGGEAAADAISNKTKDDLVALLQKLDDQKNPPKKKRLKWYEKPDKPTKRTIWRSDYGSSRIYKMNDSEEEQVDEADKTIQGLEDYGIGELRMEIAEFIDSVAEDTGIIVNGFEIIGSRARGNAKPTSDLDVVMEYSGDIREDAVFDVYHEDPLVINGIKVDVNPIRAEETGTLDQCMKKSAKYDEEVLKKESKVKIWLDDVRPAPDGYVWLKSVNEFIDYVDKNGVGKIQVIDTDHDAGDYAKDGGDYIRCFDYLESIDAKDVNVRIHSANPVGVNNIRRIIKKNGWNEVFDVIESEQVDEGVVQNALLAALLAVPGLLPADQVQKTINRDGRYEVVTQELNDKTQKIGDYTAYQVANIIARTLYAEARGDGKENGYMPVASVIYNRAKGNKEDFAKACLKKWQFSCWNGLSDADKQASNFQIKIPVSVNLSKANQKLWKQAMEIASDMITGNFTPTTNANSYYATSMKKAPSWGKELVDTEVIGGHKFGYLKNHAKFV